MENKNEFISPSEDLEVEIVPLSPVCSGTGHKSSLS